MKNISRTLSLGAVLGLCMLATAAYAQDDHTMPAPPASDAPAATATASASDAAGKHGDRDKMMKHLSRTLTLTKEQKKQVKPLLDDRQAQIEALHADTTIAAKAKKQKMRSIQGDFDTKLNAVLTDGQKMQYAKMKEDQKAKRKGVAGGEASAPAATAPAPE